MENREVEVAVLYDDHTWDTEMIEIPSGTPEGMVEEVTLSTARELYKDEDTIVGVHIHWIPPQDI